MPQISTIGTHWVDRYCVNLYKKQMEEKMADETISGVATVGGNYAGDYLMYSGGSLRPTAVTKFHQVKIDKVANGFVIEIGCKKFVAENWEVLAKKLGEYWKDPVSAEKKYCE
jgi:hypothetical protein